VFDEFQWEITHDVLTQTKDGDKGARGIAVFGHDGVGPGQVFCGESVQENHAGLVFAAESQAIVQGAGMRKRVLGSFADRVDDTDRMDVMDEMDTENDKPWAAALTGRISCTPTTLLT
jgi:hypothetical protein